MSNTPETDANEAWPASNLKLGNDSVVPAEFARKLERERDEWARLCGQFKQERDEVREKLENEMKFHHRTHAELVQTQCKLLDIEYDQLKS